MAGGVEHSGQFRLFYGATDLQAAVTESNDRRYVNERGQGENSATPDSSGHYGDFETESMGDMWERKTTESKLPYAPNESGSIPHGAGTYDSIREHGYDTSKGSPVRLTFDSYTDQPGEPEVSMGDAHHRVAAAADIERTTGKDVWIPVENVDPGLGYRHRQQLKEAGFRKR